MTPVSSTSDRRRTATAAVDEHARDSRRDLSSLASAWLLNLLGVVLSAVFSFAFAIVIARGLGAGGAGVFFAAVALFAILDAAAQLGASPGIVRTVARLRALGRVRDVRRTLAIALSPVILVSAALAIALFAFAPAISAAVLSGADEDALVPYLRVFAPFLPLAAASALVISTTRGLGSMVPLVAIEQLGRGAARLLLAVLVLAGGLGAIALAFAWAVPIAAGLVAGVWALVVVVRRAERRDESQPDAADARGTLASDFWRFTAPLGFASVCQIALLWLDTILVAALASPEEAGIYKAAARWVTQGTFANQAIIFVIGPLLTALLAQAHRERAQSVYQTATWWLTALSWPIYLTLAVFAPLLMSVFGPEFVAGATALVILSLPMLVAMAAGPVSVVLVMGGKSGWNLLNVVLALTVNIALNLLLIPPFGMTGAAIAWAAGILVNNLAPLAQVRLLLRLHPFGSGFPVVALAAGACYGLLGLAARYAFGTSLEVFLVFAAIATPCYLALLWRFRHTLRLSVLGEALRVRRLGKRIELV